MKYNYKILSTDMNLMSMEIRYYINDEFHVDLNIQFDYGELDDIHNHIKKYAPISRLAKEYDKIINRDKYIQLFNELDLIKNQEFAVDVNIEKTQIEALP